MFTQYIKIQNFVAVKVNLKMPVSKLIESMLFKNGGKRGLRNKMR